MGVFLLSRAVIDRATAAKNAQMGDFSTKYGMPDTIRTYDLQLRKLTLYPTELRAHMWIISTSYDWYYSTVKD